MAYRSTHDCRARPLRPDPRRCHCRRADGGSPHRCRPRLARLNLIGGFQSSNALIAAALVIAGGEDPEATFDTLSKLTGVRGRMQLAATRTNGASVFVDYAHTPDAVATALRALRPHVLGRLHVVLGAGAGGGEPAQGEV